MLIAVIWLPLIRFFSLSLKWRQPVTFIFASFAEYWSANLRIIWPFWICQRHISPYFFLLSLGQEFYSRHPSAALFRFRSAMTLRSSADDTAFHASLLTSVFLISPQFPFAPKVHQRHYAWNNLIWFLTVFAHFESCSWWSPKSSWASCLLSSFSHFSPISICRLCALWRWKSFWCHLNVEKADRPKQLQQIIRRVKLYLDEKTRGVSICSQPLTQWGKINATLSMHAREFYDGLSILKDMDLLLLWCCILPVQTWSCGDEKLSATRRLFYGPRWVLLSQHFRGTPGSNPPLHFPSTSHFHCLKIQPQADHYSIPASDPPHLFLDCWSRCLSLPAITYRSSKAIRPHVNWHLERSSLFFLFSIISPLCFVHVISNLKNLFAVVTRS